MFSSYLHVRKHITTSISLLAIIFSQDKICGYGKTYCGGVQKKQPLWNQAHSDPLTITTKHIGGRLKPLFLGYLNCLTTSEITFSAILCTTIPPPSTLRPGSHLVWEYLDMSQLHILLFFLLVVSYLKKVKAVAPSWIRNGSNKKEVFNLAFDDNVILIAVWKNGITETKLTKETAS